MNGAVKRLKGLSDKWRIKQVEYVSTPVGPRLTVILECGEGPHFEYQDLEFREADTISFCGYHFKDWTLEQFCRTTYELTESDRFPLCLINLICIHESITRYPSRVLKGMSWEKKEEPLP